MHLLRLKNWCYNRLSKTVTLKLSNAITSGGGNNPIVLEIENISNGNNPIGINFKPSPALPATQINLENSPYLGKVVV